MPFIPFFGPTFLHRQFVLCYHFEVLSPCVVSQHVMWIIFEYANIFSIGNNFNYNIQKMFHIWNDEKSRIMERKQTKESRLSMHTHSRFVVKKIARRSAMLTMVRFLIAWYRWRFFSSIQTEIQPEGSIRRLIARIEEHKAMVMVDVVVNRKDAHNIMQYITECKEKERQKKFHFYLAGDILVY